MEESPTAVPTGSGTLLFLAKLGAMISLGLGSLILGMLPLMIGRCRNKSIKHHHHHHHHHHLEQQQQQRAVTSATSSLSAVTNTTDSSLQSQPESTGRQGLLTSLLLCFGGGVLLFTTFLHLAPEVRESVAIHQASGELPALGGLSLAELLFCCGFFAVYLVEEAVHAVLAYTGPDNSSSEALLYRTVSVRRCNGGGSSSNSNGSNGLRSGANSVPRNSINLGHTSSQILPTTTTTTTTTTVVNPPRPVYHWRADGNSDAEEAVTAKMFAPNPPSHAALQAAAVAAAAATATAAASTVSREHKCSRGRRRASCRHGSVTSGVTSNNNNNVAIMMGNDPSATVTATTPMRSVLTVLALSFHAIFEGLAVGLEPVFGSVVYLAGAIATHKYVISFCVGVELFAAGASQRAILGYLSVFSLVTPLGIAAGLALGHVKDDDPDGEYLGPAPTVLQGMAAGTLLYVVFFEVLARERANDKSGLLQLAAIVVGFMLMLGLQLATSSMHSHSHGEIIGVNGTSSHGHTH